MSKLDKSWEEKANELPTWLNNDLVYLEGVTDFQEKAIKELEKAFKSANYPHLFRQEAIKIIKNLRSS